MYLIYSNISFARNNVVICLFKNVLLLFKNSLLSFAILLILLFKSSLLSFVILLLLLLFKNCVYPLLIDFPFCNSFNHSVFFLKKHLKICGKNMKLIFFNIYLSVFDSDNSYLD